jgi:preprotein translocase subunit SecG
MTLLFSGMGLLVAVLWVLLFLSMVLLIAVILLQEGKGGGLAEAFGGAGAETFGVKAHGINKFTGIVAAFFLLFCVLLVKIRTGPDLTPEIPGSSVPGSAPAFPNGAGGAPPVVPNQPPPASPPGGAPSKEPNAPKSGDQEQDKKDGGGSGA